MKYKMNKAGELAGFLLITDQNEGERLAKVIPFDSAEGWATDDSAGLETKGEGAIAIRFKPHTTDEEIQEEMKRRFRINAEVFIPF